MLNDTVGVILPLYKNDKRDYIALAISSILNQSYKNLKLYIGIDGPIDEALFDVINHFSTDPRVKVINFNENRGLAIVLNDLLNLVFQDNIEYIARMDADDISTHERIFKQLLYLKKHPNIDVVGGAIAEIDEMGNSRNKVILYPENPKDCRTFFAKRNPHAHPAVMFKRSFFEKVGHAYRPEYRQNQDTMLWLDGFAKNTQNANISDIVLNFRMTESLFKKRRNGWKFAKKQLKDRLKINRTLGYGINADIFGFLMFALQICPAWIRKIAYKFFR